MPNYSFTGVNAKGRTTRGTVTAESINAAKSKLKLEGIVVTDLQSASQTSQVMSLITKKKVDVKELNTITHNLSVMLKAGVPLVEAIDTLIKQSSHPSMLEALNFIKQSLTEGKSFHQSLKKFPHIFNTTYIAMCEAGELSGTLDIVLQRLSLFTEAQSRLQDKVRSSLIYPILMSIFAFFMIIFLLTYVVPKIRVLFEGTAEQTLPWYSHMLLNLSDGLIHNWIPLTVAFVGSILLLWKWKNSKKGKRIWDHVSLRLPIFGTIIRSVAISRFARTLATLLKGGVPVMDALDVVKNVVNNHKLQGIIMESRDLISRGESLSAPLIQSGEFPPMVTQMIRVGEKTGHLEHMLTQISDTYDNKVRTDLEAMTSLLEPAMLIVMGGVIAFIVFAIVIPLMQVYNIEGFTGSLEQAYQTFSYFV